jgi:hypothetical protein
MLGRTAQTAWLDARARARKRGYDARDMAQILHLGKARKAKRRAAEQAQADANAVKHGRTAEERARDEAERRRREAALDGARREPTPTDDDA